MLTQMDLSYLMTIINMLRGYALPFFACPSLLISQPLYRSQAMAPILSALHNIITLICRAETVNGQLKSSVCFALSSTPQNSWAGEERPDLRKPSRGTEAVLVG
jgi:hypothetical protein